MKRRKILIAAIAGTLLIAASAPFSPEYGSTLAISATQTASSATALGVGSQVLIANTGANDAFVKIGGDSVTATTSDMPVLASSYVLITRGTDDYISAICNTSETATLYVTTGSGM